MSDDILARLKEATAGIHQQVERQVRILDPQAPASAYVDYLSKLLGFHAPLEHALEGAGLPVLEGRAKTPLLAQDLWALGVDPEYLAWCRQLPQVSTRAQALGAAYVLEGATLGGKHVLSRLGDRAPAHASRYLDCYGPQVGARWNAFRQTLREEVSPQEAPECLAAAVGTFEALSRWLEA